MSEVVSKAVLQQCLSARLMVTPSSKVQSAEYVQIARGVVIFVCFLKTFTQDQIPKMVKSLLDVKLSFCEERNKRFSILELPGDILIVPQATLGGKMKGRVIQYHGNINKEVGEIFYCEFVKQVKAAVEANKVGVPNDCKVCCGTYGNLQVLNMETNGPYTHIIEF